MAKVEKKKAPKKTKKDVNQRAKSIVDALTGSSEQKKISKSKE